MKCTDKEQETCEVEKMGCDGCAYNESVDKDLQRIIEIQLELNKIAKRNKFIYDIDTIEGCTLSDPNNYSHVIIKVNKNLM